MKLIVLALTMTALAGCATVGDGGRSAASARYWQCLGDEAAIAARTSEAADLAADAAMGACSAAEGRLIAAELDGLTGAARTRVERIQSDGRRVVRQRVIARVVALRSAR